MTTEDVYSFCLWCCLAMIVLSLLTGLLFFKAIATFLFIPLIAISCDRKDYFWMFTDIILFGLFFVDVLAQLNG